MRKAMSSTMFILCAPVVLALVGCSEGNGKSDQSAQLQPQQTASKGQSQLPAKVKQLQGPDLAALGRDIRQADIPNPSGDYQINGDKKYDSWFLTADHVVFGPDAKLIFTKSALQSRRNFFVLARTITSQDQERPGSIIWEAPDLSPRGDAGSASAGTDNGQSENAAGGNGTAGVMGAQGDRGNDAPSLTIIAQKIENPLVIDLDGQNGGTGGKGQSGGRGGGGGHGNSASQNAFNCNRGAGNGASGGMGGNGGKGGPGGTGGVGGAFTLVLPDNQLPIGTRLIRANLVGGNGGPGGAGGDPGIGGSGGAGGAQQLPWCSGNGSPGPTGQSGQPGGAGDVGKNGSEGDFFVGNITPELTQHLSSR